MNAFPAELRLTGYGLVLREWTNADLAVMVELFDDADIAYRTPLASPFDLTAASDLLRRARRRRAEGELIRLAITVDGGRPLGEAAHLVPVRSRLCRGGRSPGRRLAMRAVRLLTDYAHREAAMPWVVLEIEPDNHASISVARSAGFHLTGTAPYMVEEKGRSATLFTWAHDAPAARASPDA